MAISVKFSDKTGIVEYSSKNSELDFSSINGKYKGIVSGSLTRLQNGDPYIIAGDNVSILTTSLGQIVINSLGGSGSGSVGPQGPPGTNGTNGIDGIRYIKYGEYIKCGEYDRVSVIFHRLSKVYKLYGDCYNSLTDVGIELHQAITQQMIELGWIE